MIITLAQVGTFFLIVARIAGLFQFAPIFNDRQIMLLGKASLVIWLSFIFVFVIPLPKNFPDTQLSFVLALLIEFLIGLLMGFTTQLVLIGIEFAGSLMDTQAGLSAASLLDPSTGHQTTLFSKWLRWIVVIMFFTLNGHHMILTTLSRSFKAIPIASYPRVDLGANYLVSLAGYIFSLGVQFAISIILIVFLIDFMFGMLSKVAPQVNVFQLGFQVKPIVSCLIFLLIVPGLIYKMVEVINQIIEYLLHLFLIMQG